MALFRRSSGRKVPRPRRSFQEWWYARRRLIAAVCTFACVGLGVRAATAEPPATVKVAAPTSNLSAGHVLTAEDLMWVEIQGEKPPGALVKHDAAVGRALSVEWPRGAPLHQGALAGSDLVRDVPRGHVAVGLALSQTASAGFVRRGDAVDVVVTRADEVGDIHTDVVASKARVLWVGSPEAAAGWLPLGKEDEQGSLVVLDVAKDQSSTVSGANQRGSVSLVVRRGTD